MDVEMTDVDPPPVVPKLSILAYKYSHPVGKGHDDLYGSDELKSGLTPLDLGPFTARKEYETLNRWRLYQKHRFEGFITNELRALESLAPLFEGGVSMSFDNVPIHPLYVRANWSDKFKRHLSPHPLRLGRRGFWHGSNDMVWEAILPAVKLASLCITNAHIWQWLDALILGKREVIPQDEIPAERTWIGKEFERFRLRNPPVVSDEAQRERVQTYISSLARNIRFILISGRTWPQTGLPAPEILLGKTRGNTIIFEHTKVYVAIETVEPLLRTDLTPAERAVDTFRLASIILHETVHAIWFERGPDRKTRHKVTPEPFFEDESVSELGFSFQNALFGGIPREIVALNNPETEFGLPAAGIFKVDWNTFEYDGYSRQVPTLAKPPKRFYKKCKWPVPVGFFLDVGQQRFWDTHVRKYGTESTHMGPVTIGVQYKHPKALHRRIRISNNDDLLGQISVENDLTEDDKRAVDFENDRIKRASRINASILQHLDDERDIKRQQKNETLSGPASQPPPPVPAPRAPICVCFDEVRNFLFAHRLQLALDTLDFRMPEHVMYIHMIRTGETEITADEWRSFLELCENNHILFTHKKVGTGYIERIDNGWPTSPLPPRPERPKPNRELRHHFRFVAKEVAQLTFEVFSGGYRDRDKEDFRQLCRAHPYNYDSATRARISEFEPEVFESLLYWSDKHNDLLIYGPSGVVRLRKGAIPEESEPPYECTLM